MIVRQWLPNALTSLLSARFTYSALLGQQLLDVPTLFTSAQANMDSWFSYSTETASLLDFPIWGNFTSSSELRLKRAVLDFFKPHIQSISNFVSGAFKTFWVWALLTISAAKAFVQCFPWNQCKHLKQLSCFHYVPLSHLFSTQQPEWFFFPNGNHVSSALYWQLG